MPRELASVRLSELTHIYSCSMATSHCTLFIAPDYCFFRAVDIWLNSSILDGVLFVAWPKPMYCLPGGDSHTYYSIVSALVCVYNNSGLYSLACYDFFPLAGQISKADGSYIQIHQIVLACLSCASIIILPCRSYSEPAWILMYAFLYICSVLLFLSSIITSTTH